MHLQAHLLTATLILPKYIPVSTSLLVATLRSSSFCKPSAEVLDLTEFFFILFNQVFFSWYGLPLAVQLKFIYTVLQYTIQQFHVQVLVLICDQQSNIWHDIQQLKGGISISILIFQFFCNSNTSRIREKRQIFL